ncbi:MAG: hypothetical protein IKQ82_00300, partial [Lentisphaeria bacterium]|nr:hypothetical protein [Lentisphaeria bacterium]
VSAGFVSAGAAGFRLLRSFGMMGGLDDSVHGVRNELFRRPRKVESVPKDVGTIHRWLYDSMLWQDVKHGDGKTRSDNSLFSENLPFLAGFFTVFVAYYMIPFFQFHRKD